MEQLQQINDDFANLSANEIEDIIIKTCFKRSEIGSKVFPILKEELFFDPLNKGVIKAIQEYYKKHEHWPKVRELYDFELTDSLKKRFEQIGNISVAGYREEYIKGRVEEFIRIRQTYNTIMKSLDSVKASDMDGMNSLVEELKQSVNFTIHNKIGVSVKKDVDEFMNYLKLKMKVVPSGMNALNSLIEGGYPSKAISVYYGQSNIGKTTILCSEAASCFARGYNVLYLSLEMPDFEIFKKIASNLLTIPVKDLRDASIEKVRNALTSVSNSDLKIMYQPAFELSANALKMLIDEMYVKEKFKPDIVFIDYINCMCSNKGGNVAKHEQLGYVTKELENLANDLDFPIVTASQFNRSGYANENAGAAQVGESLDIFKYSSVGISIYRDALMQKRGFLQFGMIKNRYGPTDLNFIGRMDYEHMKLTDATPDDIKNLEMQRASEEGSGNSQMGGGVPRVKSRNPAEGLEYL